MTAVVAMALWGCGGGEEVATAPGETGGNDAPTPVVTIERDGTTVTLEPLDEASLLTIESNRGGVAAIRSGTCESQGEVVVDLGEVGISLLSEVDIPFEELTGGGHVLVIGDSFCVKLQPE
jgi:hypothetical protein